MAVSSSTDASTISREQLNEKQQQVIQLQHSLSQMESTLKEKDASVALLETERNDLKVAIATEVPHVFFNRSLPKTFSSWIHFNTIICYPFELCIWRFTYLNSNLITCLVTL